MDCQEVAFARGLCRIEINTAEAGLTGPSFVARLWVVGSDGTAPVVADDGRPVEVHGATEELVLSSATTYLEGMFGAITEYAHRCNAANLPVM